MELDLQLYSKFLLVSVISELLALLGDMDCVKNAGLLLLFALFVAKWSITVAKCVLIMSSLEVHQLNKRQPISRMSPLS